MRTARHAIRGAADQIVKLSQTLRMPLDAAAGLLVGRHWLGRHLSFLLRQHHFDRLDIAVPLSDGWTCPVYQPEAWSSFSEIFVQGEYADAFEHVAFPSRWIDLGAHVGYFSLWVAWQRALLSLPGDVEALMVDADSRNGPAIEKLTSLNGLEGKIRYKQGLIGPPVDVAAFVERSHMSSSSEASDSTFGVRREVPILGEDQILSIFPPPIDLIKIDIEGGEYDFLAHYPRLLAATNSLLLEWHSWHPGGGGEDQVLAMLAGHGFTNLRRVGDEREISGEVGRRCGVVLAVRS